MGDSMNKPRKKPDYHVETLDNEILLYLPVNTKALHLNEAASLIWTLCDGTRTSAEIVEILSEAFPEQAATIGAEVEATLRDFVEQGALEPED